MTSRVVYKSRMAFDIPSSPKDYAAKYIFVTRLSVSPKSGDDKEAQPGPSDETPPIGTRPKASKSLKVNKDDWDCVEEF
jgi:hypothetical protein